MAAATAAVVVGAVGLISGFLGSRKASKAAKKQAKLEAEAEKKITAERIREIGKEERKLYGETIAGYTGGGVLSSFGSLEAATEPEPVNPYLARFGINQPTTDTGPGLLGSAKSVLGEQASEFAHERDITREVGATKVQQGLAAGRATANAYKWQGYSNAATGVSNLLSMYASSK